MKKWTKSLQLTSLFLLIVVSGFSQIKLVNLIPHSLSHEENIDAEPNLSVNAADPRMMAVSAFTPEPGRGPLAPIFISTDGGENWKLYSIIPGGNATNRPLYDITIRFGGSGAYLYAATLRGDVVHGDMNFGKLNVLRIKPPFDPPADILSERIKVDQPYLEATTVIGGGERGKDKVYVGNNNNFQAGNNATMDIFNNADLTTSFITDKIERATAAGSRSNEAAVRATIHPSGVAYAVFYRIITADVVSDIADKIEVIVVRDDHWGTASSIFSDLKDADNLTGVKVVSDRVVNYNRLNLGNNRLRASNLSIAVDPTNPAVVYVSWADTMGSINSLHVMRSDDWGQTWNDAGLPTIHKATNPALAINNKGKVGFLYQCLSADEKKWETHIRRRNTSGTTAIWDDVVLSQSMFACPVPFDPRCPQGDPESVQLGDYLNLIAVGKDFYGIFSASNYPDRTNFLPGVIFQREHDFNTKKLWTDATRTNVTKTSIDPFFFHITELPTRKDIYVRDFTNSFIDFDNGIEPSIDPSFCIYSDVWNRRSDMPGGFNPKNQPESEDPWQSSDGTNYAFARVHRNEAIEATSVKLSFLYSEFGTGSNYILTGSAPSPTILFAPADLEKTLPSGYKWILPPTSSAHTCLAVEISTQEDPTINSLLGHAPGWYTGTDLMVINDNNKAQRNMGVFRLPESTETSTASTGTTITDPGDPLFNTASIFAVIHNPGLQTADIKLKMLLDPKTKGIPRISVIGGKEGSLKIDSNKYVILRGMKPGESRHVRINYSNSNSKKGQKVPLSFYQIENEVIVNGFTVLHEYEELEKTMNSNLRYGASVLGRVKSLYNFIDTAELIRIADANLAKTNASQQDYINHLQKNLLLLKSIVNHLTALQKNDVFELMSSYNILQQQVTNKDGTRVALAHLSLLNTIDACLTYLQLQKGNAADILQTIYLQRSIFLKIQNSGKSDFSARLIELSNNFIKSYESRKIDNNAYPEEVKAMVSDLRNCVIKKAKSDANLLALLDQINGKYNGAIELQGHHINFLIALQEFLKL